MPGTKSAQKLQYLLRALPDHLQQCGDQQHLQALLTDFEFIQEKTCYLGPNLMLADYTLALQSNSGFTPDVREDLHFTKMRFSSPGIFWRDILHKQETSYSAD